MLKDGGVFRCVVPDLEFYCRKYLEALDKGDERANYRFLSREGEALLDVEERATGLNGIITYLIGNSHHLWMSDFLSLSSEFRRAGFQKVRRCQFNDPQDPMFLLVEDAGRLFNAIYENLDSRV